MIVSPLIGELPVLEIIIPSIPRHSAVLMMAPKFFVSVMLSRIKNFESFLSIDFSKSLIPKVFIGDIDATIP